MSNIPLPALDIKPPQQEDPVERTTRMVQLRSLLQAQPYQRQILQQQLQAQQLENQQRQYQLSQQQAVNNAYRDAFTTDSSGNSTLDQKKLTQSLAAAGHGSAVPEIMKNYNEYQSSQADLQKKVGEVQGLYQDMLGSLGATVKSAKYDPQLAQTLIQDRMNQPNLPPNVKSNLMMLQSKIKDPAQVQSMADNLIAQSPKQRELAAQETAANARKQQADIAASKAGISVPGSGMDQPPAQASPLPPTQSPSQATQDPLNIGLPLSKQFLTD